jgi:hypothetical protein
MPFAAFARVNTAEPPIRAQSRLCVIGTIGAELGGIYAGETLPALLERLLGHLTRDVQRRALADALMAPEADPMPALTVARTLALEPETVLRGDWLAAFVAVDSWIKRDRRIRAVRSLSGLPVDFFGTGWRELLGDVAGFRHVGQVRHDDIALLISNYAAVLNFDPNWLGGTHDRVYTAAAMGVPVVTNYNDGLDEAQLPVELVHQYCPNRPALSERLAGSGLFRNPRVNRMRVDVLARHNWGTRMAQWLGASDIGGQVMPS